MGGWGKSQREAARRVSSGAAGRGDRLREDRGTQGGPLGVGQLGRGSLLRTLTSGPRQEVVDNGALWMTGSSCHHPICLLACGRRKWRGDRQGLCPPNLRPASTLAL